MRHEQAKSKLGPQREERHQVLIKAELIGSARPLEVCIRDISSRGALAIASAPPKRGTYVELKTAGQSIIGRVIWSNGRRFGIRARDAINIRAFVHGIRVAEPNSGNSSGAARAKMPVASAKTADQYRAQGHRTEFQLCTLALAAAALALFTVASSVMSHPFNIVAAHLE